MRLATALFLFILVGYFLYFASVEAWNMFLVASSFIAAWEWAGFARVTGRIKKTLYSIVVMVILWLSISWLSTSSLLVLTLFVAMMMLISVIIYQRTQGRRLYQSSGLILTLGVIVLLVFFQGLAHFRANFSANILLFSFIVIWILDAGSYSVGRRFGKNKLANYVSPGKTWEGVYGGVAVAFIVSWGGLLLLSPELKVSYIIMALLMALIAVYSILGDLFESVLKRQVSLKDSGHIFPGHGGMLDRVDSMMIAAPMYYFLWIWASA